MDTLLYDHITIYSQSGIIANVRGSLLQKNYLGRPTLSPKYLRVPVILYYNYEIK